jgi:hypothetical protein
MSVWTFCAASWSIARDGVGRTIRIQWVSTFDFTSSAISQSIYQGAFAFFGPGKFGNLYTSLNHPAAKGYLHFAGEAISVRHAWVEGALDSAWRAVYEMLLFPAFQSYQAKFFANWGENPEWIKQSATHAPGKIPAGKDSLVLEHLALTHPYLFWKSLLF